MSSDNALPKSLTVKEAAAYVGVSISTLRRKIKSGELKATVVKSRYGDEYMLEINDLEQLKKSAKPAPAPKKTAEQKTPAAVRLAAPDSAAADVLPPNQIIFLQDEAKRLVDEEVFDHEKFRRNWQDLGRLIEEKISAGQMQITELIYIFQEKERLLALKDSRIKNLAAEIKEQNEEIRSLRHRKGLLRQFAEYLRGLFVETD